MPEGAHQIEQQSCAKNRAVFGILEKAACWLAFFLCAFE
jgi:hypothetical protein